MSNDVKDDIAYMRRLAEHGRRGPIFGGAFLAEAGVVFGSACFVQWAAQIGLLPIGESGAFWIWPVAFLAFAVLWFALFFGLRGRMRATAGNSSNAGFGIAWVANAVGVLVAYGTTAVVGAVSRQPGVFIAFIPMIFTFYGIAWGLSAFMAQRRWMYVAAGASFVLAFLLAALTGHPAQMAAMGAALLLLLTVPGLKLVSEEAR